MVFLRLLYSVDLLSIPCFLSAVVDMSFLWCSIKLPWSHCFLQEGRQPPRESKKLFFQWSAFVSSEHQFVAYSMRWIFPFYLYRYLKVKGLVTPAFKMVKSVHSSGIAAALLSGFSHGGEVNLCKFFALGEFCPANLHQWQIANHPDSADIWGNEELEEAIIYYSLLCKLLCHSMVWYSCETGVDGKNRSYDMNGVNL